MFHDIRLKSPVTKTMYRVAVSHVLSIYMFTVATTTYIECTLNPQSTIYESLLIITITNTTCTPKPDTESKLLILIGTQDVQSVLQGYHCSS